MAPSVLGINQIFGRPAPKLDGFTPMQLDLHFASEPESKLGHLMSGPCGTNTTPNRHVNRSAHIWGAIRQFPDATMRINSSDISVFCNRGTFEHH